MPSARNDHAIRPRPVADSSTYGNADNPTNSTGVHGIPDLFSGGTGATFAGIFTDNAVSRLRGHLVRVQHDHLPQQQAGVLVHRLRTRTVLPLRRLEVRHRLRLPLQERTSREHIRVLHPQPPLHRHDDYLFRQLTQTKAPQSRLTSEGRRPSRPNTQPMTWFTISVERISCRGPSTARTP